MKKLRKIEHYGLASHNERFDTEDKCRDYITQKKWEGGVPVCSKCGNQFMNYYITSRQIWKCSKCKKQFSLLHNTIFQGTKLPLTLWFKAIHLYITKKRGFSSYQLAEWLEIEQRSAWYLQHRLREVINNENDISLSGIVECDETHIGPLIPKNTRLQRARIKHNKEQERIHGIHVKKKRNLRGEPATRGRKKGDTKEVREQRKLEKELKGERIPFEQDIIILGMVERDGRIVLKKLGKSEKSRTIETVHPHLKKHITRDSIFITDQWIGYRSIGNYFKQHSYVNHDETFVNGMVYTNTVENVWNHFKRVILGTYFHMSYHHFEKYLHEFSFRWNRRKENGLAKFESFMENFVGKRLKYQDLISQNVEPLKFAA